MLPMASRAAKAAKWRQELQTLPVESNLKPAILQLQIFLAAKTGRSFVACRKFILSPQNGPVSEAAKLKLSLQSARSQQQICVYNSKRAFCSDKSLHLRFSHCGTDRH